MKNSIFFVLTVLLCASFSYATTVTFTDFSDTSSLQLNGSTASLTPSTGLNGQPVLRLTDNLNQSGSAFLKNAIALEDNSGFQASFSTFFSFQISQPQGIGDNDGVGADGLVFTIQTVGNNVGGLGGGIGYANINNSVGIEFDTFFNGGVDSDGNHVGINTNGNINSIARTSVSPRMNDGDVFNAWIDYDGGTDLLEVRLSTGTIRPISPILTATLDLPTILGTSNAFVGFTSGTGGASGDHDILSWQFTSEFDPIEQIVPEPSSWMLMIFGLVTFLRIKCR